MSINMFKTDRVGFEMRVTQGQDVNAAVQKKVGGFGRFLSGIGKVLGAITMPLSFVFPPLALASAGMYGAGAIGDQVQTRAYSKAAEKQQREQNTMVSFPGLDIGGGAAPLQPAAFDMSAREQAVMNVLDTRSDAMQAMAKSI